MHWHTQAGIWVWRDVGQRRKLLQGIHPKTGVPLPVTRNLDGTLWTGTGEAHDAGDPASVDEAARGDGFYRYVPEVFPRANVVDSVSKQICFSELLARARQREADAATNAPCDSQLRD